MNILRGKYFSFISRVKRAVLRVSTFQDEGVCLLNKHIQLRYVRRFMVSTFRPFSVAKLFFASLNFQTLLQFLVKLFGTILILGSPTLFTSRHIKQVDHWQYWEVFMAHVVLELVGTNLKSWNFEHPNFGIFEYLNFMHLELYFQLWTETQRFGFFLFKKKQMKKFLKVEFRLPWIAILFIIQWTITKF